MGDHTGRIPYVLDMEGRQDLKDAVGAGVIDESARYRIIRGMSGVAQNAVNEIDVDIGFFQRLAHVLHSGHLLTLP